MKTSEVITAKNWKKEQKGKSKERKETLYQIDRQP